MAVVSTVRMCPGSAAWQSQPTQCAGCPERLNSVGRRHHHCRRCFRAFCGRCCGGWADIFTTAACHRAETHRMLPGPYFSLESELLLDREAGRRRSVVASLWTATPGPQRVCAGCHANDVFIVVRLWWLQPGSPPVSASQYAMGVLDRGAFETITDRRQLHEAFYGIVEHEKGLARRHAQHDWDPHAPITIAFRRATGEELCPTVDLDGEVTAVLTGRARSADPTVHKRRALYSVRRDIVAPVVDLIKQGLASAAHVPCPQRAPDPP